MAKTVKASDLSPEHSMMIDALKGQLLIVFLKRMGGTADIPVAEVDDTGRDALVFSVNDGVFHFEVARKAQ